jgi:recombinational DNA repair protein (RecF pathway)
MFYLNLTETVKRSVRFLTRDHGKITAVTRGRRSLNVTRRSLKKRTQY